MKEELTIVPSRSPNEHPTPNELFGTSGILMKLKDLKTFRDISFFLQLFSGCAFYLPLIFTIANEERERERRQYSGEQS
ncbi:hypothetical protein ACTXT7_010652 [Hymenolepis weldensis]